MESSPRSSLSSYEEEPKSHFEIYNKLASVVNRSVVLIFGPSAALTILTVILLHTTFYVLNSHYCEGIERFCGKNANLTLWMPFLGGLVYLQVDKIICIYFIVGFLAAPFIFISLLWIETCSVPLNYYTALLTSDCSSGFHYLINIVERRILYKENKKWLIGVITVEVLSVTAFCAEWAFLLIQSSGYRKSQTLQECDGGFCGEFSIHGMEYILSAFSMLWSTLGVLSFLTLAYRIIEWGIFYKKWNFSFFGPLTFSGQEPWIRSLNYWDWCFLDILSKKNNTRGRMLTTILALRFSRSYDDDGECRQEQLIQPANKIEELHKEKSIRAYQCFVVQICIFFGFLCGAFQFYL